MPTTVTPKPLVQGVLLGNSATTVYTVPASTTAVIRSFTLCNVDTVAHTVTIYFVASGDTPADKSTIFKDISISAKQTLEDDSLRALLTGDFISAFADVASKVSFRVDGSEVIQT